MNPIEEQIISACRKQNLNKVINLWTMHIKTGDISINFRDEYSCTPLHWSVTKPPHG